MSHLKEQLYSLCHQYIVSSAKAINQKIAEAQEAANSEDKSSAGDKYETGREMMQQVADRGQAQLNEANKLMVALSTIPFNTTHSKADAGSLVSTNYGKFYIAISAGTLSIDPQNYFAVSPASPIGIKLSGKTTGDEFDLNGRAYRIESVA